MNPEEAERYLLSLELFGMRFGLDRMRRLMTALGHPERVFRSVHVVGTNGKSSTTRMIAAILARHGVRTGAYLSPHLVSFGERIRIDNRDLAAAAFGAAVGRAAHAADLVNRSLEPDDRVTQFEALTAAAYSELARARVEVAVIEAGLGGRYDATNVIPSSVQVLTSVGLEHTRWLGPTVTDIAGEKLAVVQDGATLVLGAGLDPEVVAVAERVCAEHGARLVQAGTDPGVTVGATGTFQRRNFALARTAAEAFLGELEPSAVAAAAAEVRVPGRLQRIGSDPLTYIDGAHNPAGMRALAESLPELIAGHDRVVATVSILDDKDAAGMLATLIGVCDVLIFTSSHNPR
ncbi:MAG TPA: cyanophycin synthetase, partial [Solirubrobacteraceae bacterium]|nr:cyanophycin synthetase [Solirubrobacteraceae bacterium]